LDVFTIREELGTVNGLTITLLGDLKHGRTVHSLVNLLMLYNVKLNFVSPDSLCMPSDILEILSQRKVHYACSNDLSAFIPSTDVLYVTRVQKERFSCIEEYEKVANSYVITTETLKDAKANMIIMHPLPRINEIDPTVDYDERAAYFRQMKYGLFVRMSLLALIFGNQDNFR
jgi:aspartate carbamoyltransferase